MAPSDDIFGELGEDADGILLFSPSQTRYESVSGDRDIPIIVVDEDNTLEVEPFVKLPLEFTNVRETIRFGVEAALEHEYVNEGDILVCGNNIFADTMDCVTRVRASEDIQTGLYNLFMNSRADSDVIRDVFKVAIDLGKKGQKGKPIGALFVTGDAGTAMNKSRPLSYNPFEKSHVHVGDKIVNVMLKEFSKLDGAFIISDAGKIVSAYRYLEPNAEGTDIPKGLGARHMAGAAITQATDATAIVLSESDGMVRAFKDGELIIELDPEAH